MKLSTYIRIYEKRLINNLRIDYGLKKEEAIFLLEEILEAEPKKFLIDSLRTCIRGKHEVAVNSCNTAAEKIFYKYLKAHYYGCS